MKFMIEYGNVNFDYLSYDGSITDWINNTLYDEHGKLKDFFEVHKQYGEKYHKTILIKTSSLIKINPLYEIEPQKEPTFWEKLFKKKKVAPYFHDQSDC